MYHVGAWMLGGTLVLHPDNIVTKFVTLTPDLVGHLSSTLTFTYKN